MEENMAGAFTFNPREVRRLVEHAKAAPRHGETFEQLYEKFGERWNEVTPEEKTEWEITIPTGLCIGN
jgi:hypothetical protein